MKQKNFKEKLQNWKLDDNQVLVTNVFNAYQDVSIAELSGKNIVDGF